MELIDQVDEQDNIVGQVERSVAHKEGLWHRSAHIWIYSQKGDVLIQRRSESVSNHPGLLDISAAGHIKAGLGPSEGASAELNEEIGLKVDAKDLECRRVIKDERNESRRGRIHRQMLYMYFLLVPAETKFAFNDGDVGEVFWMNYQKFADVLSSSKLRGQFVPHSKHYLEYVVKELGTLCD